MKKLICTLALGAGLLLGLSGCDLYQPDVDSLLTPPVLSELQTEVDEALRDVVGQELRLCYPAGGRELGSVNIRYTADVHAASYRDYFKMALFYLLT